MSETEHILEDTCTKKRTGLVARMLDLFSFHTALRGGSVVEHSGGPVLSGGDKAQAADFAL